MSITQTTRHCRHADLSGVAHHGPRVLLRRRRPSALPTHDLRNTTLLSISTASPQPVAAPARGKPGTLARIVTAAGLLIALYGYQAKAQPRGGNLDPLAYVQQTCPGGGFPYPADCPDPQQAIPDPMGGAWGDIKGLDAINDGTEFAVIYSTGVTSFYLDEPVITPTQSRPRVQLTIGANGMSEVSDSYGGFAHICL